jgi:endonuclease/exonuclease/phosphatase family metal-dependent hydrolase
VYAVALMTLADIDAPQGADPLVGQLQDHLRFLWWNVQSFAHFDESKRAMTRWPSTPEAYLTKLERVTRVIRGYIEEFEMPDVFGVAEITQVAATALRDAVFPGYKVLSLDLIPANPSHQVAILYRNIPQFSEVDPITTAYTPRSTRPMAAIDFNQQDQRMRVIAAHWTAPFDDESRRNQEKLAAQLQHHVYENLHNDVGDTISRHALVMGDFNNEPYDIMQSHFQTTRSRTRSRTPLHYYDEDVARVRLYNCAWKLLGERVPHVGAPCLDVAGTYYSSKDREWHTPDQFLVSGSLLSHTRPFLTEDSVMIYVNDNLVDDVGRPQSFAWSEAESSGVSDHLPVSAVILL